ncbi:hypothetical protein Bbelb_378780 [Branchiostoma belcheri]|nr:hypothetical protein Bbelb_378780 [Branchiostoma belcheri]
MVRSQSEHNMENGPNYTFLLPETGPLEWCLRVLPSDRHTRRHVGVLVKLTAGHPTLANLRLRLTYGNLTTKMDFKVGQTKGWPKAPAAGMMDSQQGADRLTISIVIQNYRYLA